MKKWCPEEKQEAKGHNEWLAIGERREREEGRGDV